MKYGEWIKDKQTREAYQREVKKAEMARALKDEQKAREIYEKREQAHRIAGRVKTMQQERDTTFRPASIQARPKAQIKKSNSSEIGRYFNLGGGW